ncbi:MAG: hypothetical protein COV10_02125 [Candidatus Vogelbacteria bacterium CG10_big_fil_rev_8_21_14_0_10_51_16]|uniref:Phosphoribosyltransferase domain-containing protein n=1 Tax=Candidatus Vogelbacteria bacterium CG10_big_fil_rev_8_21_14_0_10_51_16 TaxID=1975045 RepID=A0A2H0RFX4_9BACT|nr:MAG: hypothetical protein COV10_02125 [Candidatus Vogelbacteria bacterium CG10_big_fil_rev_8_21_14_0_10_51_16]
MIFSTRAISEKFLSARTLLYDILFPEYCVGCKTRGILLCADCTGAAARAEETPHPRIFSLFQYHDRRIKPAVKMLKYKNSKALAGIFGGLLAEHLLELSSEEALFDGLSYEEPWLLLPIPLSSKRYRTRGYNQATLLGQAIVAKTPPNLFILDTDVLYKKCETESQVKIKDRRKRLVNPRGSFGVHDPARIKKRNCIIIDDVVTTGATMREAMRVVKKAGARKLLGLSVAH